ncbi:uncharacterized protein LOC5521688 isoform X1 [Nematostella vectensis]|uniref:uncharacterized protein LOC5521688 isoform X1 n=1 Tax=Nematostella vectensis TaxID=45351 RepID=UPI002077995D|nr:uncharacterized protein LOC5521688 isoform X1 [Nematostella vectensis]
MVANFGLVFLSLCVLILAPKVSHGACQAGWESYSSYCYLFVVRSPSQIGLSWEDADIDCQSYGGRLTSILDRNEQAFITRSTIRYRNERFWIGFNDRGSEGNFSWVDGSNSSFKNWRKGEPNNWQNEDCAEAVWNTGQWNDELCSNTYGYICKRLASAPWPTQGTMVPPTTQSPIVCDFGWEFFGTSCYKFNTARKTWSMAKADCHGAGGYLVKVDDATEQNFLSYRSRTISQSMWIGATDEAAEGHFVWEGDGTLVNYTNWFRGEPNDHSGKEDCVEMIAGYYAGYWNDNFCEQFRNFICEKPFGENLCPVNWVTIGDSCFEFNTHPAQELTWSQAQDSCRLNSGADLASVRTIDEQNAILSQLTDFGARNVWIGFNDIATEGVFVWSDRTKVDYTNWSPREPGSGTLADSKDCVVLEAGSQNGTWSSTPCALKTTYLCRRRRGRDQCDSPFGMQNNMIDDSQITASSSKPSADPSQARLNLLPADGNAGAWCANVNRRYQYLQIDLGVVRLVKHIALQGRPKSNDFVRTFYLRFSNDGLNYIPYGANASMSYRTLQGNSNANNVANIMLAEPFNARFIRIFPLTWSNNICIRTELYGCASQANSVRCGVGWEEGPDDTCYQFNTDTLKIWADARAVCNGRGGDLLSIVTANEKSYIEKRIKPLAGSSASLWIGLNDRESNRLFSWSDQSPFVITRWDAGYPKDTTNTKSCVELVPSRAAWRDVDCGEFKPFICKRKLVTTTQKKFSMTANWLSTTDMYWPLDDVINSRVLGSTVASVIGNVVNASEKQNGKSALQFQSFSSYLQAGEYPGQCISDADLCNTGLSMVFTIRLDTQTLRWSRVFLVDSIGDPQLQTSRGFAVYLESRQIVVTVFTTRLKWTVRASISPAVWHHVAFTWQAGTGLQLYIDGVMKVNLKAGIIQTPPHTTNSFPLTIGSQGRAKLPGSFYMRGLGIWNRVLSSQEVSAIFISEFGVCRTGWKEYGQYCYQFNSDKRNWQSARLMCQNRGGELVSILSPVEQAHITLEVGFFGLSTFAWIGFHDKTIESAWEWSDGSPVRFTNWWNYQPDNWINSEDCAHTYHQTSAMGRWNDISCYTNMAYICKRDKEYNPSAPVSPTTAPRQQNICEWTSDALSCPSSTVISVQKANYGRTDRQPCGPISVTGCVFDVTAKLQAMCDGNPYCSVNPTNQLFGKDPCPTVRKYLDVTFVCKRGAVVTQGCPAGWQRSPDGNACYGLTLDKKTWPDARDSCRAQGAELASIHTGWESALVTSLLVTSWDAGDVWIGLTDTNQRGIYRWTDGSPVDWTNWWNGEPNDRGVTGSCVRATLTVSSRDWMYWVDSNCTSTPYAFVCKKYRQNYTPPTRPPTTLPVGLCPSGWVTYMFGCYKVFSQRKSWTAARDSCRALGANTDLVSIHNAAENNFASSLTNSTVTNLWTGLNDRGVISGHVWSDGSPVSYTNWGRTQPNSYYGQSPCVVLRRDGYWNDRSCYLPKAYMCKRKRPATAVTTQPATPAPTTTGPPPGTCDKTWTYWRGMCYLFSGDDLVSRQTWQDARAACQQAGAELISIQSAAENAFVYSGFRAKYRSWTIWIGLNDLDDESVYEWSDGSPLSYTNYNWKEPNDWQGQEDCLEMVRWNGKWNDNQCNRKNPYICKKQNNSVPIISTPSPTPGPALGRCNSGWLHYDKSCYKFVATERQNWANARLRCDRGTNSSMYGDLVTIDNQYEQAFISSMMLSYTSKPRFWIGMNDIHTEGAFYWADNSPVRYTNWNTRQPMNRANLDCVDIEPRSWAAGKWAVRPCSWRVGYICESAALPIGPTAVAPTSNPDCPRFYSKYGDSCYRMSYIKLPWSEAREVCKKEGGDLVSIHSAFEQAFLLRNMINFVGNVWTGMTRMPNTVEFTWSDQSVKEFSHWSRGQPGRPGTTQMCVQAINSAKSDARWSAVDCGVQNGFMCKINKGEPHITPTVDGKCLPGFKRFDKHCYLFRMFHRLTWPQARLRCQREGGDLVSILSQQEKDFLIYQMKTVNGIWIWTGLNDRSVERGYEWSDGSPVSFTSWLYGQPNDHWGRDNCVAVQTRMGSWNDVNCMQRRGYICKAKLECSNPLGMASGNITYQQLNASSWLDNAHAPWEGRINGSSAWCARTTKPGEYFQVDFQAPTSISKITIKGTMLYRKRAFVKAFTVKYAIYKNKWIDYMQNGAVRVFLANWDDKRVLTSSVDPQISAQYLRIYPTRWYFKICAQFEFWGCRFDCQSSLGMQRGWITKSQITASTEIAPLHIASEARPNIGMGWCPQASDKSPWIQVTFTGLYRRITRIGTWGVGTGKQVTYTKSYRLGYSNDGVAWTDYTENGNVRTFRGNTDGTSMLVHQLAEPVLTKYVRVKPLGGATAGTCLRFELYGCQKGCDDPVGMELGTIEDSWLKASTSLDTTHGPDTGRLNAPQGWCAANNDKNQYLQIDLNQMYRISMVATQGSNDGTGYVTSFTMRSQIHAGLRWMVYREKGQIRVFEGNHDDSTVVRFPLKYSQIRGSSVQFNPQTWSQRICMRVELYGCLRNNANTAKPPTELPSGATPVTGQPPTTSPPAPRDVSYAVTMKLTEATWIDDYKNRNSLAFEALAEQVVNEVNKLYSGDDTIVSLAYKSCKVIGFRRGSVIVDYNVTFIADIAQGANVTAPLRAAVKSGSLGHLAVDPTSLKIKEIVNPGGKTSPQKKGLKEGMSSGAKAAVGIVVTIVILALFVGGGWFIYRRYREAGAPQKQFQHQTFDNPISFSSRAYDADEPNPAVTIPDMTPPDVTQSVTAPDATYGVAFPDLKAAEEDIPSSATNLAVSDVIKDESLC